MSSWSIDVENKDTFNFLNCLKISINSTMSTIFIWSNIIFSHKKIVCPKANDIIRNNLENSQSFCINFLKHITRCMWLLTEA